MNHEELLRMAELDIEGKRAIRDEQDEYYSQKAAELSLDDTASLGTYLTGGERFFDRKILFAHRGADTIVDAIFNEDEWAIVSGLNPSGPLHFGHKAMFDVLLWLQREHNATVFIPITDDESYLVGKQDSLHSARECALESVIPSIIALGFDPARTHIFLHSSYPPIYQLAVTVSRLTTYSNVRGLFGWEGHENPGMVFYMGALQFASILMPQLRDLGGTKPVLVPVGIDQHPYISLARDVARKLHVIPPSELVWRFLPGLRHPGKKMSASLPDDAIFLTDSPSEADRKIRKSYSGGASVLEAHRKFGAVPEVCAAFNLLTFNLPDQAEWLRIREEYEAGTLLVSEVKAMASEFVGKFLVEHAEMREAAKGRIADFFLKDELPSILGADAPFEPADTEPELETS